MMRSAALLSDRREISLMAIAGLLYTLLYCAFWPTIYTTMDEGAYMNTAYALRQGSVYLDTVGISAPMSYRAGSHLVTQYPPGMPALLALVSLPSWKLALGTNLLIHLCGFALVALLLRKLRLPIMVALLYLLHPTAVIYSRTVMSDPASGVSMALAFLCYLRRQWLFLGIVAGLSVLLRTANGIMLPFFALGLIAEVWLERRKAIKDHLLIDVFFPLLWMTVGSLPFIAGAYGYQSVIQQGGWAHYAAAGSWGPQNLPEKLPFYALALTTLYPGMIAAPILYRGSGRVVLSLLCYGTALFYACYYFSDSGGSALETFIVGQRYLLTVLPLFILAYAALVWRVAERLAPAKPERFLSLFTGIVAIVLLAVAVGIHRKHAGYLAGTALVRDAVNRTVPASGILFCNIHVGKLLHPAWGDARRYTLLGIKEASSLQQIDSVLTGGHGPVYLAVWSRDYRPETRAEQSLVRTIRVKFHTIDLLSRKNGQIPGTLEILRIEGPQ